MSCVDSSSRIRTSDLVSQRHELRQLGPERALRKAVRADKKHCHSANKQSLSDHGLPLSDNDEGVLITVRLGFSPAVPLASWPEKHASRMEASLNLIKGIFR